MRSKSMLRAARPVHLGAGAALLAIPASAVALTAGSADAQSAIQLRLAPHRAPFGHAVTVTGNASTADAGQRLQLQFAPAGTAAWQAAGSTVASRTGAFRFATRARHSGLLRVVVAGAGAPAGQTVAQARVAAGTAATSSVQALTVGARFVVHPQTLAVTGGHRGHIRGRLLPAAAGRRIRLLTRSNGGWRTLAVARTGRRGGFSLPVSGPGAGRRWLRVAFAGDRNNAPAMARAGSVTSPYPDVASWYSDGGATACGFHAYYGVANRTLPCGTQVTFTYGGRTVTATVDDRGPFVGGRNWDLNQNTAGALGFGGVGTVWVAF